MRCIYRESKLNLHIKQGCSVKRGRPAGPGVCEIIKHIASMAYILDKLAAESRLYMTYKYNFINNDYRKELNSRSRWSVPNLCLIKLLTNLSSCFHRTIAYCFGDSFEYTSKQTMFCYHQNQVNSSNSDTCKTVLGGNTAKVQIKQLIRTS